MADTEIDLLVLCDDGYYFNSVISIIYVSIMNVTNELIIIAYALNNLER